MTYEELLAKIEAKKEGYWNEITEDLELPDMELINALRALVELHKPKKANYPGNPPIEINECNECGYLSLYPCPTIQTIEKELR